MKNRVVHNYAQLGDAPLAEYGLNAAAKATDNPNNVTSTVTGVILKAKAQEFVDAIAACVNGTEEDTLHKRTVRAALIALLDTLANDVENAANVPPGNPEIIASYGFTPASTSHSALAPGGSVILSVTNPETGNLGVQLQRDANAYCYLVEDTLLPSGPVRVFTFTDPAKAMITGTTPGSMHSVRVATMAARNQMSAWSDAVQHMST